MKALPLWQPWATLVALGAKRIETRHWAAPSRLIGQRIAIHATKTKDHLWICDEQPFATYMLDPERLPLGAVVATAVIARCTEITELGAAELEQTHPDEFAFGNYAPGRFAWVLKDMRPVAPAVPFKGRQGIFDVPDELLAGASLVSAPTVDYTALPPVPLVERPRRFSQSLMARANVCPRSAYLAVKHRGGPGSHQMDRGTLGHLVFERALRDLLRHGERAIGSPGMQRVFRYVDGVLVDELQPEDPEAVARTTADAMAALVDEVLREHPELVVPRHEVDAVREMAFHWATGYDVDPEHVAGIERLMVVDLDCGITISGRLDVIALPSPELGQVDDYKTRAAPRSQEEYEQDVQPWIYAVLLLYGVPVDREECWTCFGGKPTLRCVECGSLDCYPGPTGEEIRLTGHGFALCSGCGEPGGPRTPHVAITCPSCEGRGAVERRDETWDVGRHLRGVNTRELYPHPRLRDDGLMQHRELLLHRTAVADYKADLERDAEMLLRRFETGDFPARSGSWCTTCPARAECPLPATLRDHAGTVNSLAEAEEAWERAQHDKARVSAIEREVKNFCKAHGLAIQVGDERWEWEPTEGRAVKRNGRSSDWDGLQAAVVEAVEFGTPFEIGEWVKPTAGTTFKRTKVGTGESR